MIEKIEKFTEELNERYKSNNVPQEKFICIKGRKYAKICRSFDEINPSSAYAFVDIKTGDIYKAASWAQPAKHIRGNINDETGHNACYDHSVVYLK